MTANRPKNPKTNRDFLEKVVINAGVGRLSNQPNFEEKILPGILNDLATLTGQKAKICRAKKSIAGFKIRQNQIVGLSITLRRKKMVDFFERLINIVLPRVRDFVGIDLKSIDKNGILNIGLKEQFVFPEIDTDKSTLTFSLGINIVPKLKTRKMAEETYRELGVPLKKVKK